MSQQFENMNNKELLAYIEQTHGVQLPAKTVRAEILEKLKELEGDATPTAPGAAAPEGKEGKTPKRVSLTIHEDSDPRPYVVVGFNGRNYQINKGAAVTVPFGVFEILNNAIETVYTTVKGEDGRNKLVSRNKHRHPFSVNEKIFD